MNREQKATAVAEIAEQIKESEAVFAVDYRGITVTQAASRARPAARRRRDVPRRQELAHRARGRRRPATEQLKVLLTGPTALTFVRGDAASAAKAISTFNRETSLLEFKGGVMNGETLEIAADPGDRQAAHARRPVRPARRHGRRADHRPRAQPQRAARRARGRPRPGGREEGLGRDPRRRRAGGGRRGGTGRRGRGTRRRARRPTRPPRPTHPSRRHRPRPRPPTTTTPLPTTRTRRTLRRR